MRRALCAAAAALALSACGLNTTTKSGKTGDTLSAGGLRVTLVEFADEVPRPPGRDVSGLGTPSPGTRFLAAKVKVCTDRGQAIGTYNFGLDLERGDRSRVRFPQTVYSNGFESVRDGCGRGWIVFEASKGSSAKTLSFKYDDTGSAQSSGDTEKHARFTWSL